MPLNSNNRIYTIETCTSSSSSEGTCRPRPESTVIPIRLLVILLVVWSCMSAASMKVCLHVAIVAMVPDKTRNVTNANTVAQTMSMELEEATTIQSVTDVRIDPVRKSQTFDWSETLQGVILGSYFYTYAGLQPFAGRLAENVNPVLLSGFGIFASLIATALIPHAARQSVYLLILCRLLIGAFSSPYHAVSLILSRNWFPKTEWSKAVSAPSLGAHFGQAIAYYLTAELCESELGWPATFYVIAAFAFSWLMVWIAFMRPTPDKHACVSRSELQVIQAGRASVAPTNVHIPWKLILSSRTIWSLCIVRGCYEFGMKVLVTKLPNYLNSILNFSLRTNGTINALLYLTLTASNVLGGFFSDYLTKKQFVHMTTLCKVFQTIAMLPAALCLGLIPTVGTERPNAIIALLFVAIFGMGFATGGDSPVIPNIAPNLVGTLFGVTNLFSASMGFLAPLVVGIILDARPSFILPWDFVFYVTAAVMASGCLLFICMVKVNPKPWGTQRVRLSLVDITIAKLEETVH